MKTLRLILSFITVLFFTTSLHSQGFEPPSEGKTVVYFTRISGYGFNAKFKLFHNDQFIGAFKGKNYMRYECDPGKQLFWASSENKEFLTAELEVGGIYVVIVDIITGFAKHHVGLSPVDENSGEQFDRAKKLVDSEPPVVIKQSDIDKQNDKLQKFIKKELEHYEQETIDKHDFRHISPDMNIADVVLK